MAKSLGFAKTAWRCKWIGRSAAAYRLHNWAWRYMVRHDEESRNGSDSIPHPTGPRTWEGWREWLTGRIPTLPGTAAGLTPRN